MDLNNWKEVQLGNIVNFKRGHDLPKTKMKAGKYPVIGSNSIIGTHNEFKSKGPNVSIGRSGNVGTPFYYDGDAWPHNTSLYIDDFKGNNPRYIYYLLQTLNLNRFGGGSAVPTLNRNHIHPISVKYNEDVKEQTTISNILYNLDSKIEINIKIILIIEKISRELFKRWFIDLEFPNEQGQPYKSSGGKMIESELGIIPEGWNVKSVADISEIMSGGTPRTSIEEYWNGSIPFFTPKDVDSSYYAIFTEKHVTEAGLAKCASKLYPIDTIFITARGTVGKLALAGAEMAMNQSCYALKHESEYQYYLYLQLNKLMRNIIQSSNGAVFNAINVKDFNSYKLLYATNEVLESFEAEVAPLFKMILNLSKENDELSKLRDTLLPKLLSGEIEVPVLEPEQV